MGGTSLAASRRRASRLFTERAFVGRAIDIGSGGDPLTTEGFPLLQSVLEWDKREGHDAFDLPAEHFDVVYSSHCLEHLDAPFIAIARWWPLVKVGGHLVIVVPDEELYERFQWPSRYNSDHRAMYTSATPGASHAGPTVPVQGLAEFCNGGRIISLLRLEDGFIRETSVDQTADGTCECGIEIVVRKEA
jgi:SAM-dependent methyltransferase